jgi:hypothetical protein
LASTLGSDRFVRAPLPSDRLGASVAPRPPPLNSEVNLVKLQRFTAGQVIAVGLAATAFLFAASFVGKRTGLPVFKQIAERF